MGEFNAGKNPLQGDLHSPLEKRSDDNVQYFECISKRSSEAVDRNLDDTCFNKEFLNFLSIMFFCLLTLTAGSLHPHRSCCIRTFAIRSRLADLSLWPHQKDFSEKEYNQNKDVAQKKKMGKVSRSSIATNHPRKKRPWRKDVNRECAADFSFAQLAKGKKSRP
jgi:hypothetical protein